MRFLSVCSGIEAASVAWLPLGWKAVAFSEIEPFPCAVLAHHYPDVPNWGDMTKYKEWPDANVDLLCGGTPCQSFSVAGLRKGLDDPRGNLMLTFGAIADKYRPRWLVWENVPGVLSSNGGRDFGTFLGMLGQLGYGFAYRVLDAQYFGVAQRRRRVFVVGYLGDWRRAAAVLFERHSLRGDTAPSRETGQSSTHNVAPSLTASGRGVERIGETRGQDPVVAVPAEGCWWDGGQVSQTLDAVLAKGQTMPEKNRFPAVLQPIAFAPVGATLKGGSGSRGYPDPSDGNGHNLVGAIAFDSRQDPVSSDQVFGALGSSSPQAQAVAFVQNTRDEVRLMGGDGQIVGALAAETGMKQQCYIAQAVSLRRHNGVLAFSCKDYGADTQTDVAPTLRAMGHAKSHANAGGQVAVAVRTANTGANGHGISPDLAHTLDRAQVGMAVRRLTPIECERLQGFPDDYTLTPYRGKPAADGPRYKALGNSWAVPVARWIGERIQQVEET